MPPTDPRHGLSPEEFRTKVNAHLASFQDVSPVAVRIRSHDEVVPLAQTKQRLRACRQTVVIGETIFRCDIRGQAGHEVHHESGLLKKKSVPDVRYDIDWKESQPLVIRGGQM